MALALGETFLWALAELLSARFGDARLNIRLAKLVAAFSVHPNGSLPETFRTWGDLKAAYRFFSNRRVQPRCIFDAHAQSTVKRLEGRRTVLIAQDTTFFNYTTHRHTTGLGPIGANRQKQRGFAMHSAMAIDADSGEPLGLLGAILWARKADRPASTATAAKQDRPAKTPEEKESARWIKMLEHVTQHVPAGTRVVAVSDRESDTIEYLHAAVSGNHQFVVRATHNRRLATGEEQRLWQAAEAAEVLGVLKLTVPRADDRPARQAMVVLQVATVELDPPSGKKRALGPVRVTAILAREVMCPQGQEPLHWLLLTNVPVASAADAVDPSVKTVSRVALSNLPGPSLPCLVVMGRHSIPGGPLSIDLWPRGLSRRPPVPGPSGLPRRPPAVFGSRAPGAGARCCRTSATRRHPPGPTAGSRIRAGTLPHT